MLGNKIFYYNLFLYKIFSTAYISCPLDMKKTLGIKLPYFVMIVKNLKKYFTFEVQVCTLINFIFITDILLLLAKYYIKNE